MERSVDGEQAVSQQGDQVAHVPFTPAEVGGVGDEHVVVGLGPEHHHDVEVQDLQRVDRPVPLVEVDHQRQGVAGVLPGAGEAEAARARGPRNGRRPVVGDVLDDQPQRVLVVRLGRLLHEAEVTRGRLSYSPGATGA